MHCFTTKSYEVCPNILLKPFIIKVKVADFKIFQHNSSGNKDAKTWLLTSHFQWQSPVLWPVRHDSNHVCHPT